MHMCVYIYSITALFKLYILDFCHPFQYKFQIRATDFNQCYHASFFPLLALHNIYRSIILRNDSWRTQKRQIKQSQADRKRMRRAHSPRLIHGNDTHANITDTFCMHGDSNDTISIGTKRHLVCQTVRQIVNHLQNGFPCRHTATLRSCDRVNLLQVSSCRKASDQRDISHLL